MNLAIRVPSYKRHSSPDCEPLKHGRVLTSNPISSLGWLYPSHNKFFGGILVSLRPSVRLSVRPSVRSASRVRSVVSIVQDGFFPYLVQMINSMRGCVACDDPGPWPISSRSFGLDFENRVRSVASTVIYGFLLYLAQMITIIRGLSRVTFVSESGNLDFWQI